MKQRTDLLREPHVRHPILSSFVLCSKMRYRENYGTAAGYFSLRDRVTNIVRVAPRHGKRLTEACHA